MMFLLAFGTGPVMSTDLTLEHASAVRSHLSPMTPCAVMERPEPPGAVGAARLLYAAWNHAQVDQGPDGPDPEGHGFVAAELHTHDPASSRARSSSPFPVVCTA